MAIFGINIPIKKTVQKVQQAIPKIFGSGPGDSSILGQFTAPKVQPPKPTVSSSYPPTFVGPVPPKPASNPNIRDGVIYKPNPASLEDMPVPVSSRPAIPQVLGASTTNPQYSSPGTPVSTTPPPTTPTFQNAPAPLNFPPPPAPTVAPPSPAPAPVELDPRADAEKAVQEGMKLSPDELTTQEDLDKLIEGTKKSYLNTRNQPIAVEFITGQLKNIEERALGLAEPLERKLARLQAARTSALEASKFALERADKKATEKKADEKEQRTNQQKYIEAGITTPFVNNAGTFERVSDGKRYSKMEDFLKDAGVPDLGQAKARGLISDYTGPKGEGFTLGEGQVRYDSKGNVVATGPAKSTENKGKIVTVGGKEYWQDEFGNLSDPKIPASTPEADQQFKDKLTFLNTTLKTANDLANAAGPSGINKWIGDTFKGDTDFRRLETQVNTLKTNLMTLATDPNIRKYFGPQMTEKDVELMMSAATTLNPGSQSPSDLKAELTRLTQILSKLDVNKQQQQQPQTMEVDGVQYKKVEGGWQRVGFNQAGNASASSSGMRTDRHNNPTAFTTDIAKAAGLKEGVDYVRGDSFGNGRYFTAKLLKDPVQTTIDVINRIGFYTNSGQPRWTHTAMPQSKWNSLTPQQKVAVVQQMYQKEGNKGALNQYFA